MNNQVKEGSDRDIESDVFSEFTDLEAREIQLFNEDSFNVI